VLYGLAYFTYSQAKKAVSPIMHLARRVEQHELEPSRTTRLDLSDLRTTAEEETFVLVDAIDSFITRMDDFVERERNFTRYASHELRTPLSVIKGSVANLQQEQLSERSKRQVKRIDNTVTDMESLLDALLELARESHQSVHHEPLLFNDLAELVVEQLRETQPNPDVHLDVINNGFLSLSGSPKLIRILLTNLLKNALAYTDRGRVEVIIDAEGFSVKDTGMGIEEDKLARIFDPFYRIDHRREKGFGLGLAIVQKVCQELEWEISVSSQPGEGSCFQVNVAAT
ncbi:MAG TPA: sensor histidine kinase, partial [Gammaproteobacteria bacterium]|nr:sensor histidine kinase [Gammaproteobacteria bacterium]